MPESMEEALATLEGKIDQTLKTLQQTHGALKKLQGSAKNGDLSGINKALGLLHGSSVAMAKQISDLQAAWTFDGPAYFAGGDYRAELVSAARAAGVQIFERDGTIYCHPMVLRIHDKDAIVQIDRKTVRMVRPSHLAKLLQARQKAPLGINPVAIIENVFAAYRLIAAGRQTGWTEKTDGQGPAVPLADIYETLTIMPVAAKEYSIGDFTRDINLLDRSPGLNTKSGHGFTLPASTGSKAGKRLTMVDEHGAEKIYVAVAFRRETQP